VQLRDYWSIIRRRLWLVLLLPAVALVASSYLALRGPNAYCSNMTLAVSMTPQPGVPRGAEYYPPYWETLTSEYLADDLTVVLKSQAFAQDVSAELGYSLDPGLIVAATRTKKTHRTIDLSVCGQQPGSVAAVGDAFERTLNTRIGEYFGQLQTQNVQIRVINRPTLSRANPLSSLVAEVGLRTLLGLALGLALAFLLDYLDDRLRDRRQVEQQLGLPTLAEIPLHGTAGAR
jgi:capsular polysaccharide biosynthesis protein